MADGLWPLQNGMEYGLRKQFSHSTQPKMISVSWGSFGVIYVRVPRTSVTRGLWVAERVPARQPRRGEGVQEMGFRAPGPPPTSAKKKRRLL